METVFGKLFKKPEESEKVANKQTMISRCDLFNAETHNGS